MEREFKREREVLREERGGGNLVKGGGGEC